MPYQKKKDKRGKTYYVNEKNQRVSKKEFELNTKVPGQEVEIPVVEEVSTETPVEAPEPSDTPEIPPEPTVAQLMAMIIELQKNQNQNFTNPNQAQVTARGIIGTTDKYPVDPALYPDPTDELMQDPKLRRFAFDVNYELEYSVGVSTYETKDGRNMKEPKFHLQINGVMYDEDTGEPTNQRYIVRKLVMHEDPQTALTVARDNGLDVDEAREIDFLNAMRTLQMRDWIRGVFFGPKPSNLHKKKEMVIDNQVVEVFTINSEQSETMPFDQLKKKLKA